jgi:hypothetical protein
LIGLDRSAILADIEGAGAGGTHTLIRDVPRSVLRSMVRDSKGPALVVE